MAIVHNIPQGSLEWFAIRAGRPTASNASKLITSTASPSKQLDAYAEELAGGVVAGKPVDAWMGNVFTERGHELEDEARQWYSFTRDVDIVEAGFITDDLQRYGCSPDGLIGDDGLVELKCLPKKHVSALMYWHTKKKPPTDYIAQCHMQMYVTERSWVDLTYYNPDLPSIVIRIERDQKFDDALKEQLTACLTKRDEIVKALQELAA